MCKLKNVPTKSTPGSNLLLPHGNTHSQFMLREAGTSLCSHNGIITRAQLSTPLTVLTIMPKLTGKCRQIQIRCLSMHRGYSAHVEVIVRGCTIPDGYQAVAPLCIRVQNHVLMFMISAMRHAYLCVCITHHHCACTRFWASTDVPCSGWMVVHL